MEIYSPYQELVVMLMGAIVPELWEKVLHYNSKNVFLKCIYNTEKKCLQNQFHPGDVFEFVQGTQRIYNLGTQKTWRTNATLEAIELSVRKMLKLATEQHVKDIAMPKIGAGLGGLPWEDVKLLLQQLAIEYPTVNLIIVENYNNGISIQ